MAEERIKTSRTHVLMKKYQMENTASSLLPGAYYGYDDTWDLEKFRKLLKIRIVKKADLEMEFDLIGVDPSIANAFRRIMISEVPSMAIEKVYLYNNTSIIPDEVLAHRLGLIPLKANPRSFAYRRPDDVTGTDDDTLEYSLNIKCSWKPNRPKDSTDPDELYLNHKVLSGHIKWLARGTQTLSVKPKDVAPVHDDIVIAKLRPGHEIEMKLQAVKGIGRDHAKFSPVATAYYRLLPEIKLTKEVSGEMAERLQQCFSPGVIKLIEKKKGKKVAVVQNARYDSCSRNVLRHDDLAECVVLSRVKDHFIFSVESVGAMAPETIFTEAIDVLVSKCDLLIKELDVGIGKHDSK